MKEPDVLAKYIPVDTVSYIKTLLGQAPTELKIVKDRRTKQGDYRPPQRDITYHKITINRGLNPYAFLITLVHEIAHLKTWQQYEQRVKPHGTEWKRNFSALMAPLLSQEVFPTAVVKALAAYLRNPMASSCRDAALQRVLGQYDECPPIHLETLPDGAHFQLRNGRYFEKQKRRRTRYICRELSTDTLYLIHGLAQVQPLANPSQA